MPQAQVQTEWSGYFTKGQWHYQRTSFMLGGQDSFTQPPSQNPDMFVAAQNVLPPLTGIFQRRWGYTLLNGTLSVNPTLTAAVAAQLYFDLTNGVRRVVWPIGTQISATNEDGSTYNSAIFTAQAAPVRSVSNRGFQYFCSGNQTDLQKWNGAASGGVSNWGIASPVGSTGPNTAGTGASIGTGVAWTNPSAVTGSLSFAQTTGSGVHQALRATNFGFALATSAVIQGIGVTFKGYQTANYSVVVELVYNGASVGALKSVQLNNSNSTYTLGGSSDLWNSSLSLADFNSSSFGIQIIVGNFTNTVNIQDVQITLYGITGMQATTGAAGSITLVSGRTYFAVFQNAATGHYSDLSAPSNSTGAVTSKQINLADIPVSPDPQVSTVFLLATADGGDETLLYFLDTVTNGTTTYTDNTPDTQLVLQNVYLETDQFGNEVGVAANTPPPGDLISVIAHRGRLYGIHAFTSATNAQHLHYSKAESELLTSTGLLAGKYEEAWPGLNYFTLTTGADVLTGLLSDGQVLYIGTTQKVIRLFGDGPATFVEPEALFTDVGVLNQEVWKMIFLEGNPLGCMWLTPDYRVLGSDFNTYQDVGRPIQDVLNSINQAAAPQTAWASFMSQGIYAMYFLAVPTGSNTQPDTLLVFDLKLRQWFVWKLADKIVGGVYNITQTGGVPTFMFQAASGAIYKFDPSQLQDRVGNGPVGFPVTLTTSWLSLVDPTARLYLNEMEIATDDTTGMTVSVFGASNSPELGGSPNTVLQNANLVQKPRGEWGVFLSTAPAVDRYYQYSLVSPASSAVRNVLRLFSIEGGILHRI